jgi:hypothetical protein
MAAWRRWNLPFKDMGHQPQTPRKLAHVYGLTERGYPGLSHK